MISRSERGRPSGRPRFAVAAVVAVLAAAAFAVGCGDGGADTSAADARADFIAEADQICTEASARINAEAEPLQQRAGSKVATGTEVTDFFKQVTIPELERMYKQIGELTPPPGDEDQIEAILDAGEQAISAGKENPKSLAKPIGEGNPFEEANGLAQDYGFAVCGGGNA